MSDFGLSQYDAGQFLVIYSAMIVFGWLMTVIVPMILRPVGEPGVPQTAGQYAALASGKERYAEAVMAGLLASGHLELEGKTFHVRNRDLPRGGAETRLLSLGDTFGWKTFVRAIDSGYEEDRDTLRAAGLLTGSGKVLKARLLSIIPMVVIILFGLYRFDEGKALGEPVGVLGVLIALGLVVIVWRLLAGIRRTREGDRAMRDARQEHVGLKRAPTRDQMALGVAIFGTTVLAGTPFDPLHAMRHGGGGDVGYAGDGGGDGDGGSGCGGGGCGGCGG
ncbi:MAG: TIGR04222 domain-containing membrane protein [Citromicrobium sp.]|nr:TIGR04222 domain-containing membrane protein [Citromicrobium sp.]MAO95345.1 TIGR04222 domain-containing membrane protein [Citromicrobium sp.]MBD75298.1 TIGR04222 domain-containing membrane protein [Citromicrobium sp.]MBT47244.1 TIGR04222 domain-containing membrane protein [Citromicrobium sp.]|tara:strand:+ start:1450 stop:2283 length:834 start_codon:yes stop_codon:yes gene_type:complete